MSFSAFVIFVLTSSTSAFPSCPFSFEGINKSHRGLDRTRIGRINHSCHIIFLVKNRRTERAVWAGALSSILKYSIFFNFCFITPDLKMNFFFKDEKIILVKFVLNYSIPSRAAQGLKYTKMELFFVFFFKYVLNYQNTCNINSSVKCYL